CSELRDDVHRMLRRKPSGLAQQSAEVSAPYIAHGDEETTVALAGLVDWDNVRMLDRCGEPRLRAKASDEALIVGEFRGDQFEGYLALELDLARAIDDPHSSAAQLGFNHIAVNCNRRLGAGKHLRRQV